MQPFVTASSKTRSAQLACVLALLGVLGACGGGGNGSNRDGAATPPLLSPLARLGEQIYQDRTLSGSGRMSCASCHDPAFTHGPPNALAVQVGGEFETAFGLRAAPSIRYLERQPAFDGQALRGGLMADGRADTLAAQAHLPLLNPLELDNGSVEILARRLRAAAYAPQFEAIFGRSADAATAVAQLAQALQAFQQEDVRFHPYDSKFDQVQAGRERFSAAEQRGLQAYRDPARGNCAACHPDGRDADGRPPLFTDFGYAATGVPRNRAIPANADPVHADLGLCGGRPELVARPELCGLFRTPGLRNVARRPVFFHNGALSSLAQVLDFYNSRDTEPERWYPRLDGQVQKFDDLPPGYRTNITLRAPLDGRAAGSAPAMTAQDRADIVCFLRTLSDGHMAGTALAEDCRD